MSKVQSLQRVTEKLEIFINAQNLISLKEADTLPDNPDSP